LSFLKLMLKKFILFWNGNELSNNKDFYFFARSAPILKLLIWRFIIYFPFGLIAPLALAGVILSHKNKKDVVILEIFLFVYMLSVVFFFITARYRVPILPVLILFSAYTLNWLYSTIKQKRGFEFWKYLITLLVILILANLAVPGYSNTNPGQAHYSLGVLYSKKGDKIKSEEEYKKAILYNPNLGNAYANLGAIYGDQGKHQLALEYYQKALQNGADSAFVFYNAGIEYHNQGQLDQAQEMYRSSLFLREDDPKVHYLLGEIYLQKGMLEEALKEYQNTIRYDHQYALAFYRLGIIYNQMGRKKEAIDNFENFLFLWNGDPSQIENVKRILQELKGSPQPDTGFK